jgi:RNA polymerase sigma-70 factor (ECF subfamily)
MEDARAADSATVAALRRGDGAAFAALVKLHQPSFLRIARVWVRDASAAGEVVQAAWLAALESIDRFEGRSSLRTWIFTILANRARTRAVREARNLPFSAIGEQDSPTVDPAAFGRDGMWRSAPPRLDCDPETNLLTGELRSHILGAVDELPDHMRAVITLRDIVGMSPQEVSDILEISDGNQRVILHRARAKLRTALRPVVEVTT